MELRNNRWYDENNNSWDADTETKESASEKSKTLVNCRDCHNCSDCRDCRYCSDWKINPQRITSPKLGSRSANTTIYFNEERTEVVCGCFAGTVEEFKTAIAETHGDNDYAKAYNKWLTVAEQYINQLREK